MVAGNFCQGGEAIGGEAVCHTRVMPDCLAPTLIGLSFGGARQSVMRPFVMPT
jgi:hypothetical protein